MNEMRNELCSCAPVTSAAAGKSAEHRWWLAANMQAVRRKLGAKTISGRKHFTPPACVIFPSHYQLPLPFFFLQQKLILRYLTDICGWYLMRSRAAFVHVMLLLSFSFMFCIQGDKQLNIKTGGGGKLLLTALWIHKLSAKIDTLLLPLRDQHEHSSTALWGKQHFDSVFILKCGIYHWCFSLFEINALIKFSCSTVCCMWFIFGQLSAKIINNTSQEKWPWYGTIVITSALKMFGVCFYKMLSPVSLLSVVVRSQITHIYKSFVSLLFCISSPF